MTSTIKYLLSTLLLTSLLFSSCVKDEFDVPPIDGEEVSITANATIADLKALAGTGFTKVTEDMIISGVVIADDRSGNFFRNFILQDATGGVTISINLTDAYNLYPIGRELFIKCKGLYLSNSNGAIIVGEYLYIEDGAENLGNMINLNEFIIKGKRKEAPAPNVTSINQLSPDDIATLIQLDMVEFVAIDKNQTYADVVGRRSLNRTLQDCNGQEIVVRSSGFSDFAGDLTPSDGGTAIGIYTTFGTTKQLLIRSVADIQMNIPDVCAGGGGNGGSGDLMSIGNLRALFNGAAVPAPAGRSIKGIVTSDKDNGNINGQNLTIQDDGAGIVVRFTSVHSFAMGEELEINISSGELSEFNGLLQVADVNTGSVSRLTTGNNVTPMTLSISAIQDQFEDIESMLVKIEAVNISGNSTFSGATTLDDGTGTITLFTAFGASFAGAAVPSSPTDVTAIVSQFNDRQLFVRNLDDIPGADGTTTGGGGNDDCSPDALLCENFDSGMFGEALDLSGWTNYNVTGGLKWNGGDFDDNFYADINPFNSGENDIEVWLITPGAEVTSAHTLSYETSQHHWVHAGLSVWISTDYSEGDDPSDATWEEVEAPSPQESDEWYAWISSGDVDLSDYDGETIYVGFKFVGDGNNNTTGFRIDNVVIE